MNAKPMKIKFMLVVVIILSLLIAGCTACYWNVTETCVMDSVHETQTAASVKSTSTPQVIGAQLDR